MKVKELLKILKAESNQERLVVLSRDPEGNGFSEMTGVERANFRDGDTGYAELTPDLESQGYGEEDLLEDGEPALILWP